MTQPVVHPPPFPILFILFLLLSILLGLQDIEQSAKFSLTAAEVDDQSHCLEDEDVAQHIHPL